jgi:hypothetical protein
MTDKETWHKITPVATGGLASSSSEQTAQGK